MIIRYRSVRGSFQGIKTEPVDAARSKLILTQLATANWFPKAKSLEPRPMDLLERLDLRPEDGWKVPFVLGIPSPQQKRKRALAGKAWVKKHLNTYRIQRFVSKEKEDSAKKD